MYKKEQVNKQAVKIWREKTDLKLACTGGYCRSAVWMKAMWRYATRRASKQKLLRFPGY